MQFGTLVPTNLSADDQVVLFPSLGHLEPDGRTWRIQVHGEVFAPQEKIGFGKRILLKLLQRAMKVPREAMESEIFRQRIDRFLAADRSGMKIALRIGHDIHLLPKKSRGNGHFQATLRIGPGELSELRHVGSFAEGRLTLQVCLPDGEPTAPGQVHLVGSEGVSVISDIDDTLKHTHVLSREALLANTFLREFEPIPGMATLFREWADQGVAFHYVSSSPWQLYRNLAELFETEGFPSGSFHLRAFRLRDHLLRRILLLRRSGKAAVIRNILTTFPHRRFVLVGDSGEADPEIYAGLALKFPRQVTRVLIREVSGPKTTPQRFLKAFRGIPSQVASTFRHPQELEGALDDV